MNNVPPIAEFDIVQQFKVAYLTMRKSGCTSIKSALRNVRETQDEVDRMDATEPNPIHSDHEYLRCSDQITPVKDWFSFTVVRDPIIRFLSFYGNKVVDQNVVGNSTLIERTRFGYLPNMKLDDAITVLLNQQFETEPHVFRQSDVIDAVGFELNHVGRLESLKSLQDEIMAKTKMRFDIPHKNRRTIEYLNINRTQFEKLASYYSEDQQRFGYSTRFDEWQSQCLNDNSVSFCDEHGFMFLEEAKLLSCSIQRQRQRLLVELELRVELSQSRNLWLQVVSYDANAKDGRIVWLSMETPNDLRAECDSNGLVTKRLGIKYSKLPKDVPNEEMFVELFFWTDELEGASIENFPGKRIPFALPEPADG